MTRPHIIKNNPTSQQKLVPTLQGTGLPVNYIALSETERAEVAKNYLTRVGKWDNDKPRYLTLAEAENLIEADFAL